ncbi:MAG: hypothetical protein IJN92_09375 [Lachnospiraceae bacterium]|nr:hypothetical protein [Lachnospiraceae bacterium]
MRKKSVEEIKELCAPVINYLRDNYDPYTEISITNDGIRVKQTILGIPDDRAGNQEKLTAHASLDKIIRMNFIQS